MWWAKTVTQPSYEVSSNEYQLINHKIKIPGVVTWNDIDLTMVNLIRKRGEATMGFESYVKYLVDQGYAPSGIGIDGIVKVHIPDQEFVIDKLNSEGVVLESWTLFGAFVKSIKFSDLDYSSDELTEISMTIAYDRAELSGLANVQTTGVASATVE